MYKIAVVGCGSLAGTWIDYTRTHRNDCTIVALVDPMESNAAERKERFELDCGIYTRLSDALAQHDIDIVYDITPPDIHYAVTSEALQAGCHVFSEKPMSDQLDNAYALVELAEKTGKEYFIMQNRRYDPNVCGLRDFLSTNPLGAIGQISADFRLNPHFGGFRETMESPLVADMAIHTFDTARFLVQQNPVGVFCRDFNPSYSWYQGNANAVAIFDMADGSVFDYRGSWCANGLGTTWESSWMITCAKGSVFWDGGDAMYFESLEEDREAFAQQYAPAERANCFVIPQRPLEHRGHFGCFEEMFDALQRGSRPQTDCRDNIQSVAMVQQAIRSGKENAYVKL